MGNGELLSVAQAILGKDVASKWWEITEMNRVAAQHFLQGTQAFLQTLPVYWYFDSKKHTAPVSSRSVDSKTVSIGKGTYHRLSFDTAIAFKPLELEKALISDLQTQGVSLDLQKNQLPNPKSWDQDGFTFEEGPETWSSEALIIAAESFSGPCGNWLDDKWLPISLSMAEYRDPVLGSGVHRFNLGADFCISLSNQSIWGSYRNLYEDRGYGFRDKADAWTIQNIEKFQADNNLTCGPAFSQSNHWVRATCDGLPLVGTLPVHPGLWVFGGFSGRSQNYAFAGAKQMAQWLFQASSNDIWSIFTTKRFA
jgi:hypothetical protein